MVNSSIPSNTEDLSPELSDLRMAAGRARALTGERRAKLGLRYLKQQAHLTAPASDIRLAEKALMSAPQVAERLLERYGITAERLASQLDMDIESVTRVLTSRTTPLVVLDLEDGVPPALVDEARRNAARLFREAGRRSTLAFFRPSGIESDRCFDDIVQVLVGAAAGSSPGNYPVDGLVFPKLRHIHEIAWLYGLLDEIEKTLSLPPQTIKVIFQIETGWGVLNLADLANAGLPRLVGLVLGTVDLAADLMLPRSEYRHPISSWARTEIVGVAGAVAVPAIDGMTIDFPIPLKELSTESNAEHLLQRIRANFDDARYSIDIGMSGRWVGHPLQLLATMLAFQAAFPFETLRGDVELVESFAKEMAADRGAVAGPRGELLDIGTDRHLRSKLRRATAWGLFPLAEAVRLGVVSEQEASGA